MAINFVARKCACGGKLEFDPAKKIWICKYCGTVVEREATFDKVQVDGIEGITDVVRQTLMDVANNKMDSAARNLEDCERKNHKHVGTLIANISYSLSMISCAKSQDEARGYLDKVKVYANRLHSEFPQIAEDEINMYEAFGDGVADVYANLLAVFDTLNDASRVEYISSKLRPSEIFSEYANKNLLKIALKRKNYDIVRSVIKNIGHIDKKFSLQEILFNYPDDGEKIELITSLFTNETAEALTKNVFEKYFSDSSDSIPTKTSVIRMLAKTELRCNAEAIVQSLHEQMTDYELAKMVYSSLYESKLTDQETEALFVFNLMVNKKDFVLKAFLDALTEQNIFVQLSSRAVISFLDSTSLEASNKAEIVKKMFEFEIDGKSKDAIYNYYLNNNNDSAETRRVIIDTILEEGCPISNATARNYIIKTSIDGENKLDIIKKIFNTGINKTYLGDLLSDYMISSQDETDIKDKISDYLIEVGYRMDSSIFTQYVISKNDSLELKIPKLKKLLQNGTQIKSDCIDSYLLSINSPDDFSEEVFNIICTGSYSVSTNALAKFLLGCRDIDKIRHFSKLFNSVSTDLNSSYITVSHLGNQISGNVLQVYVLLSNDNYDITNQIVSEMIATKIKLNGEISKNGASTKFKKYVGENKASLSPLTLQLCEENKMFSLF